MTEIQEYTIQYIQIPDFTIEHISGDIQSLNRKIRMKFTSGASNSVIFRWDFGDGIILNTPQRTTIHEYEHPGTYTIKHQACVLDLPCCYVNDIPWCIKTINVEAYEEAVISPILTIGLATGFILTAAKKKCQDYNNKEECEKHNCQWIKEKKKCINKIIPTKEEKVPKPKVKPITDEDKFLIAKLREKGVIGEPICTGEVCKIGKWIAVARKGKEPIIIHDP